MGRRNTTNVQSTATGVAGQVVGSRSRTVIVSFGSAPRKGHPAEPIIVSTILRPINNERSINLNPFTKDFDENYSKIVDIQAVENPTRITVKECIYCDVKAFAETDNNTETQHTCIDCKWNYLERIIKLNGGTIEEDEQ